ncbi:MAG: sodium:solute symporter [Verrucomicrobia bacterium]|nr:sodium:solute symporter [Verrucomicrobiota bacterium]MBI3871151.1 sodium:solute symporter [Verrucomicrobiota bacterium]
MSPILILGCIAAYFACLLGIASVTGRNAGSAAYYLGNKQSPWYVVAFGLIGDSLSGVTFISVPGAVGLTHFSYLQVVLGYMVGYAIIAAVLLPLYYRLNLTSIYGYLLGRFGRHAQRTGAAFFLVARLLGAGARLYLAASVIQTFVFDAWHVPFWLSVTAIIALILAYTYRGGIRTLVWTDTFQSTFLLLGVVLSIAVIQHELGLGWTGAWRAVADSPYSDVFFWDWRGRDYFWKQFLSGVFLAVVMTGLDQNSMQKNLSCPNLKEAQKNLYWFGVIVVLVNALFLGLGALLYAYASAKGIATPQRTDQLFPLLALQHLGPFAAVVFVIGLTAATFSSADSVLTALTTSFCLDLLGMQDGAALDSRSAVRTRHITHVAFAVLLLLVILGFRLVDRPAIIQVVLDLATYTYGPLMGLFVLGMMSHRRVSDRWIPILCAASPAICWWVNANSKRWFRGYEFGFELLILNALITMALLWAAPRQRETPRLEGRGA